MYSTFLPNTGLAGPRITTAKRDRIVEFPTMNAIEPIPIFLSAEAGLLASHLAGSITVVRYPGLQYRKNLNN